MQLASPVALLNTIMSANTAFTQNDTSLTAQDPYDYFRD